MQLIITFFCCFSLYQETINMYFNAIRFVKHTEHCFLKKKTQQQILSQREDCKK